MFSILLTEMEKIRWEQLTNVDDNEMKMELRSLMWDLYWCVKYESLRDEKKKKKSKWSWKSKQYLGDERGDCWNSIWITERWKQGAPRLSIMELLVNFKRSGLQFVWQVTPIRVCNVHFPALRRSWLGRLLITSHFLCCLMRPNCI